MQIGATSEEEKKETAVLMTAGSSDGCIRQIQRRPERSDARGQCDSIGNTTGFEDDGLMVCIAG
jgi:hypothetical protein